MADERNDRPGDQQPISKFDWNGKGCKIMILAMIYFAMGLLLTAIIIRFLRFADSGNSLFFYIWTFYLFLFIAMLLISIWRIRIVMFYFRFMRTKQGIGVFMIFIGTLLFDWNQPFELCVSILLVMVGILYFIYGCKVGNPENEEEKNKENEKKEKKKGTNKRKEQTDKVNEDEKEQPNENQGPTIKMPTIKETVKQDNKGVTSVDDRMRQFREGIDINEYGQEKDRKVQGANDNAPSYVPKDGGPTVYQNQPGIANQMNPSLQEYAIQQPNAGYPGNDNYGQNPGFGVAPADVNVNFDQYDQDDYPEEDQYSSGGYDEDSYQEGYNQNRFNQSPASFQNDPTNFNPDGNMGQPGAFSNSQGNIGGYQQNNPLGNSQTRQWQPPGQDVDDYLP